MDERVNTDVAFQLSSGDVFPDQVTDMYWIA